MKKIYRFKEIGSTQDKAKELASRKVPGGIVVVADTQAGGKGRFGREWLSPVGGLWFSRVLYPEISPGEVPRLTMLAGVAVAEAVKTYCGVELKLKWPNDVVHEGKNGIMKAGGILTEAVLVRKKVEYAVMGIGINVNNTVGDRESPAVSLKQLAGTKLGIEGLLKEVLRQFDNYYLVFTQSGIGPVWERYRELSATIGRKVVVDCGNKIREGAVSDIQSDGALVLKSGGKKIKILAGDIRILR